jgi:hypothetical protein
MDVSTGWARCGVVSSSEACCLANVDASRARPAINVIAATRTGRDPEVS